MVNLPTFSTLLLLMSLSTSAQETSQKLIAEGLNRLNENQVAQESIDKTAEQIQKLEKKYQDELKLLDGLNMYNSMLKKQLDDQVQQINKINVSINNATLIERQIMPLLVRMVDALETFISIDVPFLYEERVQRVAELRILLEKAEYSTSEKCRRVFEAYQIENEFGYTIESYKGRVDLGDIQFAVDYLRIGRIGLMYRDLAGEKVGFWNKQTRKWQPLTERQYKRHITKGLKIAREEISPELITMPLLTNIEVR
jgi:hypothetical protein